MTMQVTQIKNNQITQIKNNQITQIKNNQITQIKNNQITQIKNNQIYKSNKNLTHFIIISGKKGSKYLCKVLTNKTGVYNGSHSMNRRTIEKMFTLVS